MKTFASLFETFTEQAFRYEALPVYTVPEEAEAFQAFVNGDPIPPEGHEEWLAYLRECNGRGKRVCRVRLVPEPRTKYFEFEYHRYIRNMEAGEAITALHKHDLPPSLTNVPDFWLFDCHAVAVMNYDIEGRFLGADIREQPGDLQQFLKIAGELQSLSGPFSVGA